MSNKFKLLLFGAGLFAMTLGGCQSASSESSLSDETSTETSESTSGASSDSSSNSDSSSTDDGGGDGTGTGEDVTYTGWLRIWYHVDTMDYTNTAIYLWNSQVKGNEYEWTNIDGDYGAYFEINLGESDQFKNYPSTDIRMIIKAPGTWSGQSDDTIIPFGEHEQTVENGVTWLNIYTGKGEGRSVNVYSDRESALGDSLSSAYVHDDWKTVTLVGSGTQGDREAEEVGKIADFSVYKYDATYYAMDTDSRADKKGDYLIYSVTGVNANTYTFELPKEYEANNVYVVEAIMAQDTSKTKTKNLGVSRLYDTEKFEDEYTYTGDDLGVVNDVDGGTRRFTLWAPTSGYAKVRFYYYPTPASITGMTITNHYVDKPMTYIGKGAWRLTVYEGDDVYKYNYYNFVVNNSNGEVEAVDPYATATGVNGIRGAIVDFDSTDTCPDGWEGGAAVDNALTPITSTNQLTIYEAHIRDLTADETWVTNNNNRRGGYNAFCEEGTTYQQGDTKVTTGFDHIKELGVNAIQLLPVFDQDNDERANYVYSNYGNTSLTNKDYTLYEGSYNWGYNPANYNVPEGAYSSSPMTPTTRIKEYRNLIQTAANNDIRIIMDVVYNHMSSVSNNSFTKLVPQYFFRMDDSGNYTDGSGCGNEFASERTMARKFIVNSVCWWAETYRVKGFRFDLMGLIDMTTMKEVRAALNEIDPTIVMYGEGWTAGSSGLDGSEQSTTSNTYLYLNTDDEFPIGCFNDSGRNGTKGNTTYGNVTPSAGFLSATNPGSDTKGKSDVLYNSLTQIIGENRDYKPGAGCNPNQTINYVACHDNYTLYDQLNYQLCGSNLSNVINGNNELALKASTAAQAISLFGQGAAFINGGDEIFRQKLITSDNELFETMVESYKSASNETSSWIEGDGFELTEDTWLVRNSYQYGDAVNSFKWDRKVELYEYYEKWVELVALRNDSMENYLGQSLADVTANKTYCFDSSSFESSNYNVMGGGFTGRDSTNLYIFMANGLGGSSAGNIGIGNGNLEVLYSSSDYHAAGETISITDNNLAVGQYECLIVKRTSGE